MAPDTLEELITSDFRGVVLDENGSPVGNCFAIYEGIVVSARHVIADLTPESITPSSLVGSKVLVEPLSSSNHQRQTATVVIEDQVHDLVLLSVAALWCEVFPSLLSCTAVEEGVKTDALRITAYGQVDESVDINAVPVRSVSLSAKWEGYQVRSDGVRMGRLQAGDLLRGMSGAAVCSDLGQLVGVVSARYHSANSYYQHSVTIACSDDVHNLLAQLLGERVPGLVGDFRGSRGLNPYRGLKSYSEQYTNLFFGRQKTLQELIAKIDDSADRSGLVLISGPSGVGKSSILHAGLLPHYKTHRVASDDETAWPQVVTFSDDLVGDLARVILPYTEKSVTQLRGEIRECPEIFSDLLDDASATYAMSRSLSPQLHPAVEVRPILLIDQFERIFTQSSENDVAIFMAVLDGLTRKQARTPRPLVVLFLRADFEVQCNAYDQLSSAVQDRYLVGPLRRSELRDVIRLPALRVGSNVDDDLVEFILDEMSGPRFAPEERLVENDAFSLPFLSHALAQTWASHEGGPLSITDYMSVGGTAGAMDQSGERAYEVLNDDERVCAKNIFIRLVSAPLLRSPTSLRLSRNLVEENDSLGPRHTIETVLEVFISARLLTRDAEFIQVAHESLIGAWRRFHGWLEESVSERRMLVSLMEDTAAWEEAGHNSDHLYLGAKLGELMRVTDSGRLASNSERRFIEASRTQVRKRRSYSLAIRGLLAGFTVLSLIVGLIALQQRQYALEELDLSTARQLADASRAAGAHDPERRRQTALASWGIGHLQDARSAVLSAAASPALRVLNGHQEAVNTVRFGADGKTLASASVNSIRSWDVNSGDEVKSLLDNAGVQSAGVRHIALSSKSQQLAASDNSGHIKIWDLLSGARNARDIQLTENENYPADALAFSPDGRILAVATYYSVLLVDVKSERVEQRLSWHQAQTSGEEEEDPQSCCAVANLEFSPDGTKLGASVGYEGPQVWTVGSTSGASQTKADFVPIRSTGPSSAVAFSPDSHALVSAGDDGKIYVYDFRTRKVRSAVGVRPDGEKVSPVSAIALSPDSSTIAMSSGTAVLRWRFSTLRPVSSLIGHSGNVTSLAYSPDGRVLASGSDDATVRLWDAKVQEQVEPSIQGAHAIAYSAQTRLMAIALFEKDDRVSVRFIHPDTKDLVGPKIDQPDYVNRMWFLSGGSTLAIDSANNTTYWNVATGQPVDLEVPGDESAGVINAVSSDGSIAAFGNADGATRFWNIAAKQWQGEPLTFASVDSPEINSNEIPASVNLNSTGTVVVVGLQGRFDVANVQTGATLGSVPFSLGDSATATALSPSGNTLAVGYDSGLIRLWSTAPFKQLGFPLAGHSSKVEAISFDDSDDVFVSGAEAGDLRLWDVSAGQEIGDPFLEVDPADTARVEGLVLDEHGGVVVSQGLNFSAQFWDVSYLPDPVRHLCSKLGHPIDASTWRMLVGAEVRYRPVCP